MPHGSSPSLPGHPEDTFVEVLAAVFSVRPLARPSDPSAAGQVALHVLLWQRGQHPDAGKWALPGGIVLSTEDVDTSAQRQLAEKVDLTRVSHLEQIGVFSAPHRMPDVRTVATGFLGLVPLDADPTLPADTAWHPVGTLPPTALDHGVIVERAHRRLQAKLSYTNIGFALAPAEFTIAELRQVYATALGHDVDPTNLHRILLRRGMLEPTGTTGPRNPVGGRPAALHRFTVAELRVTDPFAAFRPPEKPADPAGPLDAPDAADPAASTGSTPTPPPTPR
ncbi:8-oxo-dGTP diphosphatase [Nakamurella sp. UYEF19]|uniref:NUDIX hydrolase n=1 Tax=Nakamurella sp. UYEF19 TaxID=1756392 RepID=UPI003399E13A